MKEVYLNILAFLEEFAGFDYSAYHPAMLERRIQNRILKTRLPTPEEYFGYLQRDPDEPARLIENFMINVSHFFRDPLCFEILAKTVIPGIVQSKQKLGDNTIRIWSAGCSRGEEAYSVAILLDDCLKQEKSSLSVDFFATDFDAGVIELAKKGDYPADSIREVKYGFLEDYFIKNDQGFLVRPSLKSMIRFSVYDLLDKNSYAPSESIFGDFDLVLCRNVLIYFHPEYQERILHKLYKSLKTKGILILGESEVPVADFKGKFRQITRSGKIFEKIN
jgi:chemotaxis protein methyltransferase CheR